MIDEDRALRDAVSERYAIERELGRGGMATVYLARDLRYARQVAIKVLRTELSLGVAADRFQSEIMIAAGLAHPNIVPVFDSGGHHDRLYYVMPFIEGESLRALLDREHHLSLDRALAIVRDVGDALVHAHARNIVHRDIKPENILLVEGRAVVTDFGIARAIQVAGSERLTAVGIAVGTPLYMSPEQASGDETIDGRSDVYSLATVLYEMLSGTAPHDADTPQRILARKLTDPAPRLRIARPDVPAYVDDALARALAVDTRERPATIAEFLAELRDPAIVGARRGSWSPRRMAAVAMGIAVVVIAGVLAIVASRRDAASRTNPRSNRVVVAVFPFRATMPECAQFEEAIPDLLATALEGTPGVTVADPWAVWRPLRPDARAHARSPDVAEAASLARSVHAGPFILGSIAQINKDVQVTVRVYRGDTSTPAQTLSVSGPADSLFVLVRSLSVDAIRALSPNTRTNGLLRVEHSLTRSPDALKAWLVARESQRRGAFDSADVAIDRAIALDSNFVLALVDGASIKSWTEFSRGVPYDDQVRFLAERAARLTDSAADRPRWRAQAMLASVNSDGPRAVTALHNLLANDSTDFQAWQLLAYVHITLGWQYGATPRDMIDASEQVVRLDSTDAPAMNRRLYLALTLNDSADIVRQIARARRGDTTSAMLSGMLRSAHALTVDDRQFAALVPELAKLSVTEWISMFRILRSYRPDRAERAIEATRKLGGPMLPLATRAAVQLMAAEGRWHAIDSLRRAGVFAMMTDFDRVVDRLIVAGAIAGAGDDVLATRSLASLAKGHPPDSALAQVNRAMIWQDGWLIGACEAMYGDTVLARRWQIALGALPAGSPPLYATALRADIAARLAARRGDRATALDEARHAYVAWSDHSSASLEITPEPAMRFHLAGLLRAAGKTDSAVALFRSLVMPTTWMGFYTARSSLELGELMEQAGDRAAARTHYLIASRLWESGDRSVADLRERARRDIAGLTR
jgi:hypothetical protein